MNVSFFQKIRKDICLQTFTVHQIHQCSQQYRLQDAVNDADILVGGQKQQRLDEKKISMPVLVVGDLLVKGDAIQIMGSHRRRWVQRINLISGCSHGL